MISGLMADETSLRETKMASESLLEIKRNKIAIVENKNDVDQEKKREWLGVTEKLLAIVVFCIPRGAYGIE